MISLEGVGSTVPCPGLCLPLLMGAGKFEVFYVQGPQPTEYLQCQKKPRDPNTP